MKIYTALLLCKYWASCVLWHKDKGVHMSQKKMSHWRATASHMDTHQQTVLCVWWSFPPLRLVGLWTWTYWCASAQTAAVAVEAQPRSSILHRSTHTEAGRCLKDGNHFILLQDSMHVAKTHIRHHRHICWIHPTIVLSILGCKAST